MVVARSKLWLRVVGAGALGSPLSARRFVWLVARPRGSCGVARWGSARQSRGICFTRVRASRVAIRDEACRAGMGCQPRRFADAVALETNYRVHLVYLVCLNHASCCLVSGISVGWIVGFTHTLG